jgi:hypothetical protein
VKPASAKAKGRRLQQAVRDMLLDASPRLEADDIRSTSMGASGEDLLFSPAARRVYPIAPECKNTERLNVWAAIKQARAHATEGQVPAVFFTRNREEVWACVPASELVRLYATLHHRSET